MKEFNGSTESFSLLMMIQYSGLSAMPFRHTFTRIKDLNRVKGT